MKAAVSRYNPSEVDQLIFSPDCSSEAQTEFTCRRVWEPERALLAHVMRDAIDAIADTKPTKKERRKLAIDWLMENDYDWPFAFAYICSAFGYHVEAARERILSRHVPAWPRERASSGGTVSQSIAQ